MQDNEILILEELAKNSDITQRYLSKKTELSALTKRKVVLFTDC